MTKKVKRVFGENPEKVHVLDTFVEFDENGHADVEDHIAEVFGQIPGYELEVTTSEEAEEEDEEEATSEEEEESEEEAASEEAEEAPKAKRPAMRKAPGKR